MPYLTGSHVPMSAAMAQLARSHRDEPFGPYEGVESSRGMVETALRQLVGLMNRFMGIIEMLAKKPEPEEKDDFMKGWGEEPELEE